MESGMTTLDKDLEERVLVVDDDPDIAEFIGSMLKRESYLPTVLTNPDTVLPMLEKNHFDLAFVDIKMPRMSGLELAAAIKHRSPQTEIVFMTGHGTFDNAVQAIKVGAYDYLGKPFSLDELRLCLRRFEDLQALKRQVASAERRYFYLVQNIPSLIFVIRRDLSLEFLSHACQHMLGYTPEEALNEPQWLLRRIYAGDRKRAEDLFSSAFLSGGSRFSMECRMVHGDGHLIHTLVKSISREPEVNGGADRLQGLIVDITDRVFLERAEVQREKLKILREVAGDVAHEIRNPLVSIGGFARRLKRRFPELSEWDIILGECERLENIVKRITGYLQPVEVTCEACSVNQVLFNCREQVAPEMEREGIMSEINLARGNARVYMDTGVLSQVCLDLMHSIVKEMGPGETLSIRTYEGEENLYVEFRGRLLDKPSNIEKELLSPFDPDEKRGDLSLSCKLLRKMGGLLSCAQEEDAAVFTVALPKKPVQEEIRQS
jgi:two-component system, NtrC family, sensor histidine kinase HydH